MVSKIFRFLDFCFNAAFNAARIARLRMLYPGLSIDFKSTIQSNCSIICVKGARLQIKSSYISAGTLLKAASGSILSIDHSFIGRNCVIVSREEVRIHENCLVAEMVVIRDQDHIFNNATDNYYNQQFLTAKVEILSNAWIASKATILKGVTIGQSSIIAASAVVNSNVPPYELWGGVPAKLIKPLNPPV